jgi:co-chaperonin GroES (HSP10)
MAATVKPLQGWLTVKPEAPDEKTVGGIILPPPKHGESQALGRVVAFGPPHKGEKAIKLDEGTLVVFRAYSTVEIDNAGVKVVAVPQRDLIAFFDTKDDF